MSTSGEMVRDDDPPILTPARQPAIGLNRNSARSPAPSHMLTSASAPSRSSRSEARERPASPSGPSMDRDCVGKAPGDHDRQASDAASGPPNLAPPPSVWLFRV